MTSWKVQLRDLFIAPEPDVPTAILDRHTARFAALPAGSTVCIKVSCAYDLPYPFAVSGGFTAQVIAEIRAVNSNLDIILMEGGVGKLPITEAAARHGLDSIEGVRFVDAESSDSVFVANTSPSPYRAGSTGSWNLPRPGAARNWPAAPCGAATTPWSSLPTTPPLTERPRRARPRSWPGATATSRPGR